MQDKTLLYIQDVLDNKLNTLYRMCTNVFVTTISIMFYSGICWKYIVIYYKDLAIFDIDKDNNRKFVCG